MNDAFGRLDSVQPMVPAPAVKPYRFSNGALESALTGSLERLPCMAGVRTRPLSLRLS